MLGEAIAQPDADETSFLGRVLVVAGSDSGAGAGIQADLKTVMALGGYAMTAITAVTAQNTQAVSQIQAILPEMIAAQMTACLDDIGADVIKTGMLGNAEAVRAVVEVLAARDEPIPLVVDPVMLAKDGAALLDHAAIKILKDELCLRATILTPNIPEAEHLVGFEIRDLNDMKRAADVLMTLGPEAILIKGGHMPGGTIEDVLLTAEGFDVMMGRRIESRHTHGTGCTLASAIAASLAQGLSISDAVKRARAFVREGIRAAPGIGRGQGPLNHAHAVKPFGLD